MTGPVDWAARWVARFQVYHQRRFGPGAAVAPTHLEDFVRFIAARWHAPEWQPYQAEAALRDHFGISPASANQDERIDFQNHGVQMMPNAQAE